MKLFCFKKMVPYGDAWVTTLVRKKEIKRYACPKKKEGKLENEIYLCHLGCCESFKPPK